MQVNNNKRQRHNAGVQRREQSPPQRAGKQWFSTGVSQSQNWPGVCSDGPQRVAKKTMQNAHSKMILIIKSCILRMAQ